VKAVVTGANGFVGPHLVRHLSDCGDEVVGLDKSNGPDLLDSDGWRTLDSLQGADVLYHLAGWSHVGTSWKHPLDCFAINGTGTANVLEAAKTQGVSRVVLISSAEVYDPANGEVLDETCATVSSSPYAASKLSAEALAKMYWNSYELEVVVARPFNHIGPGQSATFAAAAFANQIAAIERGESQTLSHGNLKPVRDLSDVRDVVSAYRLLAEHGEPGEIYNVASGIGTSMQEVVDVLSSLATAPITLSQDDSLYRPADCPSRIGSAAKLVELTSWAPQIELKQTLADILQNARAQQPA
jgi:GDP-4-dehydro-6-deoxy-D-mannose reductase